MFTEVGLQHPNLRSATLLCAFFLKSPRSSFDGFSKIAIMYGIVANN